MVGAELTRAGALRLFPGMKRDSLVGAIRYYDAQTDEHATRERDLRARRAQA